MLRKYKVVELALGPCIGGKALNTKNKSFSSSYALIQHIFLGLLEHSLYVFPLKLHHILEVYLI